MGKVVKHSVKKVHKTSNHKTSMHKVIHKNAMPEKIENKLENNKLDIMMPGEEKTLQGEVPKSMMVEDKMKESDNTMVSNNAVSSNTQDNTATSGRRDVSKQTLVVLVILAVIISLLGTFTVLKETSGIHRIIYNEDSNSGSSQAAQGVVSMNIVSDADAVDAATGKVTFTVVPEDGQ